MKILLLSNQGMVAPFVGNPIMPRYRDAILSDGCIESVDMLRCKNPLVVRKELRRKARQADLIHIHFGGVYAFVTWFLMIGINKPKFITFHGTDIHAKAVKTAKSVLTKIKIKLNQYASFFSILCYTRCGFVAEEMENFVPSFLRPVMKEKAFIQPLGVDYKLFRYMDKREAQIYLGLCEGRYILFSDVSNTPIKRRDIAKAIVDHLPGYTLLIMCGVKSEDVPNYVNACDCLLLTSDQEGSPNIIREALSLDKPVFSVDVGDAMKQLEGLRDSAIISRNPEEAAKLIRERLSCTYTDNSRESRRHILDFAECSKDVIELYKISTRKS